MTKKDEQPAQQQRGGVGSQNIQIGTLITGPNPEEVRAIAQRVFEENFSHLAAAAGEVAAARAAEVRDEIVTKLADAGPESAHSFDQVEKQIALLEAQKGYALSGDEELREHLVKLVIDISTQPERSKKSIILQEAIKVMPLLTSDQMRAVAAAFIVRFVHIAAPSLELLFGIWEKALSLNGRPLDVSAGDLRHLEYAGCGKITIGSITLSAVLKQEYPSLLGDGYSYDELQDWFGEVGVPKAFLRYVDSGRFRPVFHNTGQVKGEFSEAQIEKLRQLINQRAGEISDSGIASLFTAHSASMHNLYSVWEKKLEHFDLTSVGIAVGHAVVCAAWPDIAPVDIWL
ncbi:MAG: LPO_1073/Vpar_1526 family protein [Pseudomonadota bacterium]